jgi:hypothetical protein
MKRDQARTVVAMSGKARKARAVSAQLTHNRGGD